MNPLISRKELAKRWAVSPATIDRMAYDGIITKSAYGKYRLTDIEAYEQNTSGTKQTETFMERRLRQQLIAKDAEIVKLKQKLFQVAELSSGYMQELVREAQQ